MPRPPALWHRLSALILALALLGGLLSVLPAVAAPSSASTATVTNGGNFRSEPRVAPQTVIGQVCPGDRITIDGSTKQGATIWYYATVSEVVADCDPAHVDAGTAAWLSATLVQVDGAAIQPAPPASAGVTITQEPGAVRRGATASVAARTAPHQSCSIVVEYKSGPSKAAGLVPKAANASGDVSWSWKVGTRKTRGDWPVIITCRRASATTYVTVQ
jgi:hypothetical protein